MLQVLKDNKFLKSTFSWLGLFSSFGTLLCCALPSTLVLLGLGSTLASFLGNFPQLIWLSENKGIVFSLSFFMLGLSFLGQKIAEKNTCPIDKREDCEQTKSWTKAVFYFSFVLNLIGAVFAFILPWFMS